MSLLQWNAWGIEVLEYVRRPNFLWKGEEECWMALTKELNFKKRRKYVKRLAEESSKEKMLEEV